MPGAPTSADRRPAPIPPRPTGRLGPLAALRVPSQRGPAAPRQAHTWLSPIHSTRRCHCAVDLCARCGTRVPASPARRRWRRGAARTAPRGLGSRARGSAPPASRSSRAATATSTRPWSESESRGERRLRLWPGGPPPGPGAGNLAQEELRPYRGRLLSLLPGAAPPARSGGGHRAPRAFPCADSAGTARRSEAEEGARGGGWSPSALCWPPGRGETDRDLPPLEPLSRSLPAACGEPVAPTIRAKWTLEGPAVSKKCHSAPDCQSLTFCSVYSGRNMTQRSGFPFCCLTRRLRIPQLLLLCVTFSCVCHALFCFLVQTGLEGSTNLFHLLSNKSNQEQGYCETEARLASSLDFWTLSSENLIGIWWHIWAVVLTSGCVSSTRGCTVSCVRVFTVW